jgi:hypothetical protein
MRTLLFTLALLFTLLSYSQDIKINPTELGCLRLGMSYDELVGLLEPKKLKVYYNTESGRDSGYIQLDTDYEGLKPYEYGRKNDSILSYYKVRNINISPNIKVKFVVLGFYNDSLFYIEIDDDHLLSSLKYKYGEPNYTNSYDTIVCRTYKNGYVDKDTLNYYIESWVTNNGTTLKWGSKMRTWYRMDFVTEFYYSDIFNKVKPILLKQESDYNEIQKQKEIEKEKKKHLGF